MQNILVGLILFFVISIGFFFLFRFVVLWYFKVDKIISLLEDISKNLTDRK